MNRSLAFLLVILLMICFMTSFATGEAGVFYTSEEDLYYHTSMHCDFRNDLREASPQEIENRFPCNICVQDDTVYDGIEGMNIGDLVIIRVPDDWMRSITDLRGIFADTSPRALTDENFKDSVSLLLHGDEYNRFIENYLAERDDVYDAYYTDFYHLSGQLSFHNDRHIGSCWYVMLYCGEDDLTHGWTGELRFFCGKVLTVDGVYFKHITDEWEDSDYDPKTRVSTYYTYPLADISSELDYKRNNEISVIEVYSSDGVNVLKYVQKNIADDLSEYQRTYTLFIDEHPVLTLMDPLVIDTDAIYWFFLTEAEKTLIEQGASVNVIEGYCAEEYYDSNDMAIISEDGPNGWNTWEALIDRQGNALVYRADSIYHIGNRYFCYMKKDSRINGENLGPGVLVVDADSLEIEGFYSEDKEEYDYLLPKGCNNSVFASWSYKSKEAYIVSSENLEVLKEYSSDKKNADTPLSLEGDWQINVEYIHQTGKPQRIVLNNTNGYWLADNYGERVTDNYDMIEPLLWYGENGLFLIETGTDEAAEFPNDMFRRGYRGQKLYYYNDIVEIEENETWQCGLIDKDGNVLAECAYTEIKVISESAVRLTKDNGETVLIDLKDLSM